jgi:hypothetical protein
MSRRLKTIAFAGLLAACALVGGAGTKSGDPTTDLTDAVPPPEAPPAPVDQPLGPPPDLSDLSAAPPSGAPSETSAAGAEAESSGPEASSAPITPAEPDKRPRFAVAVIQALDKVTAETIRFEAPINQPIRYKTLIFVVHACETTAPDEPRPDAAANMEIDSQPLPIPGRSPPPARRVFRGWMFADSPGLNLFQHPVYDAWLVACKTALPST